MIIVFDLAVTPSEPLCTMAPRDVKPKGAKKTSRLVRQCAFSEDSTFLIAVDEHSNVMQYERV